MWVIELAVACSLPTPDDALERTRPRTEYRYAVVVRVAHDEQATRLLDQRVASPSLLLFCQTAYLGRCFVAPYPRYGGTPPMPHRRRLRDCCCSRPRRAARLLPLRPATQGHVTLVLELPDSTTLSVADHAVKRPRVEVKADYGSVAIV